MKHSASTESIVEVFLSKNVTIPQGKHRVSNISGGVNKTRTGSDRIGLTKPGPDRTGLTKPGWDCVRLTKPGLDPKKSGWP